MRHAVLEPSPNRADSAYGQWDLSAPDCSRQFAFAGPFAAQLAAKEQALGYVIFVVEVSLSPGQVNIASLCALETPGSAVGRGSFAGSGLDRVGSGGWCRVVGVARHAQGARGQGEEDDDRSGAHFALIWRQDGKPWGKKKEMIVVGRPFFCK